MAGKRFVTEYSSTQYYGGPEEGGWWYWVTEAVRAWKFSSARSARAFAEKRNEEVQKYNKFNYIDRLHYSIESKRELGSQDNTNKPRPHYE